VCRKGPRKAEGNLRQYVIIGVLGLVVICVAIVPNFWLDDGPTKVAEAPPTKLTTPAPPNKSARESGIPVPVPPPVAKYRPGQLDGPKVKAAAPKPGPSLSQKPEFDVVRINPDGDVVIAGRAAPGVKVKVLDGVKSIGTVTADHRGEWVLLPTEPLSKGKRELGLNAIQPDGQILASDSVVILAVPKRTGRTSDKVVKTDKSEYLSGPLAVLVPKDGRGPSRVLQKPTEEKGVQKGNLSIGVVDYDEAGKVSIGGKAKPGEDVQVYLDNKIVGHARTSSEGEWRVEPKDEVSPGIYKLRADSVASGQVTARVEIPFSRADRVEGLVGEALVIVRPGNSLWRIARRTLGSGTKYTTIYAANRAKILDPNLIYPGQVFSLPWTN